jgi:hypothetical protein
MYRDTIFVHVISILMLVILLLLLTPDLTSSRLWSRWRAPATLVAKRGDYSYLIEIDGVKQWVHANKLRQFDVRIDEIICEPSVVTEHDVAINSCSIVYDKGTDFGDVESLDLWKKTGNLLPS